MRKILEIWERYQHQILATVKENNVGTAVSSVLGVSVGNTGNPYKPETMTPAKNVHSFKKSIRRFKDQEHLYLIFQKHFLEHMLCSPFQTLRLGNITAGAKTFLPLGGELLKDMEVQDRLGFNAQYKSFAQVAKEQKLGWWSKEKVCWVLATLAIIGISIWLFPAKKADLNLFSVFVTLGLGMCILGLLISFIGRAQKRKVLLADFNRAQQHLYLGNHNNERWEIFHNGTDRRNLLHGYGYKYECGSTIRCDFLDFNNPESPDLEVKKQIIRNAADRAISMGGKLFYLLGEGSECHYEFDSKEGAWTFGFYIAEIGIEIDDMVLFIKEWPATSTGIPNEVILGHAEKRFQEEGLNLFRLSSDF